MIKDKKLTVVKSNELVEASYRLSLGEKRLLLACIAKLDSKGTRYAKKDGITIKAQEFSQLFNIKTNNGYRDLEAAAENLFERRISFDNKNHKIKYVSRWAGDIDYNYGEGSVTIHFSRRILPFITQLKGQFTKYQLEKIAGLTSAHAIRIYEICLQYLKIGSRDIEVDKLKKTLGVEELYSEFKDFNKRVLKPSVEQINKQTDLRIQINPIRKMRKVVALKIDIRAKEKSHKKVSKQKINSELKKIFSEETQEIPFTEAKNEKLKKPSFTIQ